MIRLTREQVRDIDRRAIEQCHIPGIILMENAARGVADQAWKMVNQRPGARICIICGKGNNGGDGYAAARHLHNRGAQVRAVGDPPTTPDAHTNYLIAQSMALVSLNADAHNDLLIDALFGTGLTRALTGTDAQRIEQMNSKGVPILSIDVPSGLDCDTGQPLGACVIATHTVTFVTEKIGFANPASRKYTGIISIADIGCPRDLIHEVTSITTHQSP
jgi:NAD(P)H-hydrate epimerase